MRSLPSVAGQQQQQPQHQLTPCSNLLVKYVPNSVDNRQLENFFTPFGRIEHAKTIKSKGKCLGYGFVKFVSLDDAVRAEHHFSSVPTHLSPLQKVQFARDPESHKLSLLSFCSIPANYSHAEVIKMFEAFGPVCQTNISWSNVGWSGTIRLETPDQAQAAINALDNWQPVTSSRPVSVKLRAEKSSVTGSSSCSSKNTFGRLSTPIISQNPLQSPPKPPVPANFPRHSPGSSPDSRASRTSSASVSHRIETTPRPPQKFNQDSVKAPQRQTPPRQSDVRKNSAPSQPSNASFDKRQSSPRESAPQKNQFFPSSSKFTEDKRMMPSNANISSQPANGSWLQPNLSRSCILQADIWKPPPASSQGQFTRSEMPTTSTTTPPSGNPGLVSAHSHSVTRSFDPTIQVTGPKLQNRTSISGVIDKPVEPLLPCRFIKCPEEQVSLDRLFSSLQLVSNRLGSPQGRF